MENRIRHTWYEMFYMTSKCTDCVDQNLLFFLKLRSDQTWIHINWNGEVTTYHNRRTYRRRGMCSFLITEKNVTFHRRILCLLLFLKIKIILIRLWWSEQSCIKPESVFCQRRRSRQRSSWSNERQRCECQPVSISPPGQLNSNGSPSSPSWRIISGASLHFLIHKCVAKMLSDILDIVCFEAKRLCGLESR